MIEIEGLTKRYGARYAVRDLTFTVLPGRVTGFLGPNGYRTELMLPSDLRICRIDLTY